MKKYILSIFTVFLLVAFVFISCNDNPTPRTGDKEFCITVVKEPTREEYEKVQEEGGSISAQYTSNGVEIEVKGNKYKVYGYAKADIVASVINGQVREEFKLTLDMTLRVSDELTCNLVVTEDSPNVTLQCVLDKEDVTSKWLKSASSN